MDPAHDHNIWKMILDQTPNIIRAVLATLTVGISLLIGYIWKNHREKVDKAINEHRYFITDRSFSHYIRTMDDKVEDLDGKFTDRLEHMEHNFTSRLDAIDIYVRAIMKHIMNDEYNPSKFIPEKGNERKD